MSAWLFPRRERTPTQRAQPRLMLSTDDIEYLYTLRAGFTPFTEQAVDSQARSCETCGAPFHGGRCAYCGR